MKIHAGCSGWVYWHWRGIFYPDTKRTDKWFRHYTESFDTVELNAPFYSWPKDSRVKAWRRNAPEHFRYSVKVNRLITRERRLRHTRRLINEFYKIDTILGEKLGCFLFQFPTSYKYTPSRLRSIVTQLNPKFRNGVEFHRRWIVTSGRDVRPKNALHLLKCGNLASNDQKVLLFPFADKICFELGKIFLGRGLIVGEDANDFDPVAKSMVADLPESFILLPEVGEPAKLINQPFLQVLQLIPVDRAAVIMMQGEIKLILKHGGDIGLEHGSSANVSVVKAAPYKRRANNSTAGYRRPRQVNYSRLTLIMTALGSLLVTLGSARRALFRGSSPCRSGLFEAFL